MKPTFTNFASIGALVFKPTPGQVSADLAGELAILDPKSGIYYGLDPVGARIWSLLQPSASPKTVQQIRDTLLEEYEVTAAQLETDLLALLADLHGKALIESADERAA